MAVAMGIDEKVIGLNFKVDPLRQIKVFDSFKSRIISGSLVFTAMVIIITPFCGLLFDCGCNWPWLGLDENCNYYQKQVIHQCPWCRSITAGGVSVGLSFMAGVLAALAPLTQAYRRKVIETLIRILLGMLAFSVTAAISAVLSAEWFHYPSPVSFLP